MTWKPIAHVPAIAKKNERWLRLKGDNEGPYVCIGYWHDGDWHEVGTEGQVLTNVTHWAPFT